MNTIRHLTVSGRGLKPHRTVGINLQGEWLRSLGFNESDKVEVICQEGRIVISNITE